MLKFLLVALLGPAAFASQTDRDWTVEFYRGILNCRPLTINCLAASGLIKSLAPGLYAFNGKLEFRYPDEIISAGRLARVLNKPVVLVPNLPGLKGVPTIDALVFDGEPVANLSIKSFRGQTMSGILAIKRNFSSARLSHKELYSYGYLPSMFGFAVGAGGELIAKWGTPEQALRKLILRGVLYLLGLTPESVRPVWLGVDLIDDEYKTFVLARGTEGHGRIPYAGTFLEILDRRKRQPIPTPSAINLEHLSELAGKANEVSRYLMLIRDAVVDVDKNGFLQSAICPALIAHGH